MIARIVRRAGMFIGTSLNESEDALAFADYADRWTNTYLTHAQFELPEAVADEMRRGLEEFVADHLRQLREPGPWGWKAPRTLFLLPFLDQHFQRLKFLHVVRDGRDMAFSPNQNQLRKHGSVIGARRSTLSGPEQSIMLWSWANQEAAHYGERRLKHRYLRIRFEDVCREPVAVAGRIFEFLGLQADPAVAGEEVSAPPSLGRWRQEDTGVIGELERLAHPALKKFGYALQS